MYPSDVENYWISCAPKEVIYAWLDATPECTEDPNPDARAETAWPKLDPWDMSELEFGEDLGWRLEAERKAKIREWQRTCGTADARPT